jgi:hypothetical protein
MNLQLTIAIPFNRAIDDGIFSIEEASIRVRVEIEDN